VCGECGRARASWHENTALDMVAGRDAELEGGEFKLISGIGHVGV
jgi:hypothetical protein